MEHWRYAPGYEGYQVSNEGNVKSLNYRRTGREKLLIPEINGSNGYLSILLYKDGNRKRKTIHKLIAQAFIPNPHGYTEVNHKDEDKANNFVFVNEDGSVDFEKSNLEWCTHEYNINYGTRNQRVGEGRNKKVYQYTLEGTLVKIWASTMECDRNGFNSGAVSACCNNKYIREGNNKSKGYKWSYTPL